MNPDGSEDGDDIVSRRQQWNWQTLRPHDPSQSRRHHPQERERQEELRRQQDEALQQELLWDYDDVGLRGEENNASYIPQCPHQQQQQAQPCRKDESFFVPTTTTTTTNHHHPLLLLGILFMMDGLSLALPTTALLYMINTHVMIPLHLLPSYYALSFLPNSCKPIYAMLTNYIISSYWHCHHATKQKRHENDDDTSHCCRCCCPKKQTQPRQMTYHDHASCTKRCKYIILSILFVGQSLCIIGTCSVLWIPSPHMSKEGASASPRNSNDANNTTIIICWYVWGILRTIGAAWSEYILQILLLDYIQQRDRDVVVNNQQANHPSTEPEVSSSSSSQQQQQHSASWYQSQSSMARNIGSLIAYCINAFCFYYYHNNHSTSRTRNTTNDTIIQQDHEQPTQQQTENMSFISILLFIITAFIHILSAIITYYCSSIVPKVDHDNASSYRDRNDPSDVKQSVNDGICNNDDSTRSYLYEECPIAHAGTNRDDNTTFMMRWSSYHDNNHMDNHHLDNSLPSYPLLASYHNGNHPHSNVTDSSIHDHPIQPVYQTADRPCDVFVHKYDNHSHRKTVSVRLIILMQTYLILLIIQQPMASIMTKPSKRKTWIESLCWIIIYLLPAAFYMVYEIRHTMIQQIKNWYHSKQRLALDPCYNHIPNNSCNDNNTTWNELHRSSSLSSLVRWDTTFNLGIFLILRNAIPNVSYLLSSYIYTIFERHPYWLSYFSIIDGIITTIACYTYGLLFSNHNNNKQYMKRIIISTTFFACIVSLMNIPYIWMVSTNRHDTDNDQKMFKIVLWTILLNALSSFTNEWKFLPDVILATITSITTNNDNAKVDHAAVDSNNVTVHSDARHGVEDVLLRNDNDVLGLSTNIDQNVGFHHDHDSSSPMLSSENQHCSKSILPGGHGNGEDVTDCNDQYEPASKRVNIVNNDRRDNDTLDDEMMIGLHYSSYLSCIDYGDQLNSIILGRLIVWLGTSRENNWEHFDIVVVICAVAMLIPLFSLYFV